MGELKFKRELKKLINQHSRENESDTPDFILAQYMLSCLEAYEKAIKLRDEWFDYEPWTKEETEEEEEETEEDNTIVLEDISHD